MTFINSLLLSAGLHVQSYCSYFYSFFCPSCSPVTAFLPVPVREAALSYPVEGALWAMAIFVIAYYRALYHKKLLSHEKLGLIRNVLHQTHTSLTLGRNLLEEIIAEGLNESTVLKLQQALEHTAHVQEGCRNMQAFGESDGKIYHCPQVMEYELHAYVSSVINHCKVYAGLRGLRLQLHQSGGYVRCCMNKQSMTAALEFLVRKMIEITPSGGQIDVTVSCGFDFWTLRVSNGEQGAGNKYHLSRLVSACMPELYWGSLQLAKNTIRLHGGTFHASRWDKASVFEVTVPIAGKSEQPETASVEPAAEKKDAASPALSRVLLVMTDKELGDFLCARLAGDFNVTLLTEPERIFSFCSHEMPDAIIIDEMVNGVGGEELCSRLKSNHLLSDIPLVLLAASADDEKYITYIGCGAEKVLSCSIHVSRLKAELGALIDQRVRRYVRIRDLWTLPAPVVRKKAEKKEKAEVPFAERLKEYVEKNLSSNDFSVRKLCSDMGMSRTSLYTKIKEDINLSPEDYIFLFKMEKAKVLLATRQHNVSEVASLLGFCDAKYFGKRFKRFYKVSPSEYVRSIT